MENYIYICPKCGAIRGAVYSYPVDGEELCSICDTPTVPTGVTVQVWSSKSLTERQDIIKRVCDEEDISEDIYEWNLPQPSDSPQPTSNNRQATSSFGLSNSRLTGLLLIVAGAIGGICTANTISHDQEFTFFGEYYTYTAPFSDHEIAMIFLSIASVAVILIGICLLLRKEN